MAANDLSGFAVDNTAGAAIDIQRDLAAGFAAQDAEVAVLAPTKTTGLLGAVESVFLPSLA